ncbi:hypothetical protein TWF696_001443 [Orbilia brochopaga]|uniref:Uncharacterized protein n=1 Tax=Orbilia brochopaga TaxID=3140254 RepID=A0AAV9U8N9_9PEZI
MNTHKRPHRKMKKFRNPESRFPSSKRQKHSDDTGRKRYDDDNLDRSNQAVGAIRLSTVCKLAVWLADCSSAGSTSSSKHPADGKRAGQEEEAVPYRSYPAVVRSSLDNRFSGRYPPEQDSKTESSLVKTGTVLDDDGGGVRCQ